MTLWCVIPVKPFEEAKSRMAPELSPQARARLASSLFRHTLCTVLDFAGKRPVLVVSRSAAISGLARAEGALAFHEEAGTDMNAALGAADRHARHSGASAILAVSADLPLLTEADLAAMVSNTATPAIAPDRHGTGTNALFWSGPSPAPYLFGPGSFQLHLAAMTAPRIIRRKGLALDLDEMADLACLQQTSPAKARIFQPEAK